MVELERQINFTNLDNSYVDVLSELTHIFNRNGHELFLVGGCVRDLLLNRKPKDVDLCTSATPDQMKVIIDSCKLKNLQGASRFRYWDSGIKHGTLTITDHLYNLSFEVTTYRVDGKYSDNRHPDEVTFTPSLEEDLKRRDFTINSFAFNLLKNKLVALDESYLLDLEFGIIRAVGKAKERFTEDALRMLRALRFSAQLNFSIALDTYEAIKECAKLISNISKERIRDELTKILLSDNPQVLELFVITGLEQYALGKTPIGDILNCPHDNPWHYTDVFHHTMDVVKRVPKTFELRWAALFHDFGKPHVKKLKEGTENHYNYHGHQDVSADIALGLMEDLKFSNEQNDLIFKFVKYHDSELVDCKNSKFKTVLVDIGIDNFKNFMQLKLADANAHCLTKDTKYAIEYPDKLYARYYKVVSEKQGLTVKDLAINGYDMMNLGFTGPEIGKALNKCLEEVLENPDHNTKEYLLTIVK